MKNNNFHSMNRRRNLILALLLTMAIGLAVAWFMFLDEFYAGQREIIATGNLSVETFDREFMVRMQTLKGTKLLCDQYLDDLNTLTWNPAEHLKALPEKGGYVLNPIGRYSDRPIGELTGLGSIPPADSIAAKEMGMAVFLTPVFEAIEQRDPETPWIYYTSASRFIYIYPKISWEEFFFSPEVFTADFYRGVTPTVNPGRNVYWTPKYLDLAGKGYMVTVSIPIYKDDIFLGSLSIDISLDKLKWLLERYDYPYSRAYLVDSNGELLIDSPGLTAYDYMKLENGVPRRVGDYYLTRLTLSQVNWSIIIQTSHKDLVMACLNKPIAWGFVVALLLFCGLLIFQLSQSIKEIAKLSTIDSLTGLYNRRQFDIIAPMVLGASIRRKGNIAFLIYDLDDFKKLNDMYGHQKGDVVLTQVSQTVSRHFKRNSDYIFRTGGEEFIIIAVVSDQDTLQKMADRICEEIYQLQIPNQAAKIPFITISLGGIFIAEGQYISPDEAYKLADKALYYAKEHGKNRAIIRTVTE